MSHSWRTMFDSDNNQIQVLHIDDDWRIVGLLVQAKRGDWHMMVYTRDDNNDLVMRGGVAVPEESLGAWFAMINLPLALTTTRKVRPGPTGGVFDLSDIPNVRDWPLDQYVFFPRLEKDP